MLSVNSITPPYYAVIFTSLRTETDPDYDQTDDHMMQLVKNIPGFIGVDSARSELGISVSYWRDLESIKEWKNQIDHLIAQRKGKEKWYQQYTVRIALVEKQYEFFNSI